MTYDATEKSLEKGSPVELYEIQLRGQVFTFTSSEEEVDANNKVYKPVPIERTKIAVTPREPAETIEVTMPADEEFSKKYIDIVPGAKATLTIIRYHHLDSVGNQQIIWKGVVQSVGFSKNGREAKLAVMPVTKALDRNIPHYTYQSLCNHELFGVGCGVTQNNFRHNDTVASKSGNDLVVNNLSGKGNGWATGGYITVGSTDFRLVIAHSGDQVTLLLPFPEDLNVVGKTVDVYAGCDHTIQTCKNKFDNVRNYGGYAFVPDRNPFEGGID